MGRTSIGVAEWGPVSLERNVDRNTAMHSVAIRVLLYTAWGAPGWTRGQIVPEASLLPSANTFICAWVR